MTTSSPVGQLEIPQPVRARRALRCLRAERVGRKLVGGPRRDQLLLRALDAVAAAGLGRRHEAARRRLAVSVAAAGLPRLPVFTRPRSMYRSA